jgi:brefeldin A-resistance guanine nucleotide exchange factor 1
MRAPVVLHAISSFEQDSLETSADSIVSGLKRCIDHVAPLRSEITKSPDFWSILHRLYGHPAVAQDVFDLLKTIVEFQPPVITADNYEAAVNLANEFATAGSAAAVQDTRRDVSSRRGKPQKPQEKPK